jgi:hypothetical protein
MNTEHREVLKPLATLSHDASPLEITGLPFDPIQDMEAEEPWEHLEHLLAILSH